MRHPALRAALLACVLSVPVRAMADPASQDAYATIPIPGQQAQSVIGVVPMCVTGAGQTVPSGVAVLCGSYGTTAPPGGPGGNTTATIAVIGVTTTQTTGATSSTAGTWTQALAAAGMAPRKGCLIANTSGAAEYAFFGPNAPTGLAVGLPVTSGGALDCAHGGLVVAQDAVWIASASASAAYVLLAQ